MKQKWLGLSAILIGMSTSALMQTMIATSMPSIARDLGGMNWYSWVFGGYMLASTITIPLFARLADLYGRRILYVAGMAIFLIGSTLIGFAPSMEWLVACRVLQGIGAGTLAPAALASIGDLFDEKERGKMFGIIGAVQVLANLIGPPLGGWVTDTYSWRWGFFLIVPIGMIASGLASRGLSNQAQIANRKNLALDWQGALIIGLGLCAGLLGLQTLAENIFIGVLLCIGAIVLLSFAVTWEKRQTDPVIPIPLLQIPAMWQPVLGTLFLGVVTNSAVAYVPLYLQKIFSQSATQTGLALIPILLMAGIGSGVGGSLANRYPRPTQICAWLSVVVGFLLLAIFHPENILGMAILIGAGLGLLLPVYLQLAQHAGGETHLATASGLIQMARNLGGAMGIPLLGAWLTLGENLTPFITIYVSLAFIGILGLALGLRTQTAK